MPTNIVVENREERLDSIIAYGDVSSEILQKFQQPVFWINSETAWAMKGLWWLEENWQMLLRTRVLAKNWQNRESFHKEEWFKENPFKYLKLEEVV